MIGRIRILFFSACAFAIAFALDPCAAGPVLSDSNLFAALNLTYPGLSNVQKSVVVTNYAAAKTNLAIYLRGRTNVQWFFDWHHPSNTISYSKSNADLATNGTVTISSITYTFTNANIDWYYNVTKDTNFTYAPNNEWQWQLNRMYFWPTLGDAYWGTGVEAYAACWVNQFRDWTTSCPAPTNQQNGSGSCWRTIESGLRMSSYWPNTYHRIVLAPSCTDTDVCDYLKSCIEHSRYLRAFPTSGNWVTMEMSGLYTAAALYPEVSTSSEWRAYATTRLYGEQTNQFYPDGVQKELSPGYHGVALGNILQLYTVANLEGRGSELPTNYLVNLEKEYEHYLHLMAPDRTMPQFNDSVGAANAKSALTTGYSLFTNRMDFLWVSSGGASGAPPTEVSWSYPWAGYQIMRSGWDTNANYLCLDAGPLGAAHQHEDKLNVVIWAYGRKILFDSGGGEYETSIWRTYGISSYSHNTIVVDGKDQKGGDGSASYSDADYVSQTQINARWESDIARDFAAGFYSGGYLQYTNRPASQTRRVLFVKPDIYLVADTMTTNYAGSHTYEARWHLWPTNSVLDPVTKVATTTDAGVPNLAIVPCLLSNLTVVAIVAQTNPALLGWNIKPGSVHVPATTVTHSQSGAGTKQFLTMLLPLQAGATNPVSQITSTGPTSARIDFYDGRRIFVSSDPNPTNGLTFKEILADGTTNRLAGGGFRPPWISSISNVVINLNTNTGPISFKIGDADSAASNLVMKALPSNPKLVTWSNIIFGGTSSNRTVTITPLANHAGSSTITLTTVDPNGATASTTFNLTVQMPAQISYFLDTSTNAGLQAADGTWNGTNANWSSTSSGSSPLLAWPVAGNDANFIGAGGTYSITVSGTQNVNHLTTTNGTFAISGGLLNHIAGPMTFATHGNTTISSAMTSDTNFVKVGTGTLTFANTAEFPGDEDLFEGTLRLTVDNAIPAGSITMGNGVTAARLDLSNVTLNAGGICVASTNSAATNYIVIGSGRSLFINGSVVLGVNATGVTTRAVAIGSNGTLSISGISSIFQIGTCDANLMSGNTASLDLSSLGALNVNYDISGVVRVGDNSGQTGGGLCTLILAATNSISAGLIGVGESGRAVAHALKLGTVSNFLNAAVFNIGTGGRDGGSISFATNSGALVLRGFGGGTNRADMNIGIGGTSTGSSASPVFDVRGHFADIMLDTLFMGDQQRAGSLNAGFYFSLGNLDINSVVLAQRIGTGTNNTSLVDIGGGTVNFGAGGIVLASNAIGAVNFTGGVITCSGDIAKNGPSGTGVFTLNGANLDMKGNNIGSADLPVNMLNFYSGTLQNVGEINGGGSALVKSGSGMLTLAGTNTFSGGTLVSAGAVVLAGNLGSSLMATAGVVAGSGIVTGSFTLGSAATFSINIGGTDPIVEHSQIVVAGTNSIVTLAGALTGSSSNNLPNGAIFTIIKNDSPFPVVGTFSGLPQLSTFTSSGRTWRIDYFAGTGSNDVAITLLSGGSNAPPFVTMLLPTNTAVVFAPITLQADASDPNNDLAGVQFYGDGSLLGTVSNAPFTFVLSNVTLGTHTTWAVAIDSNGFSATSGVVQVTVGANISAAFIPAGAIWKYLDNGSNQGTAWRSNNFNDVTWSNGPAQLGFGDGDEATVISRLSPGGATNMTFYFRRGFYVPDATRVQSLGARMIRDDGAVVYLNGAEIWRDSMPTGAITYLTQASATISGSAETSWIAKALSPSMLQTGTNLLSAEIHQVTNTSTDASFDFQLTGTVTIVSQPACGIGATATNRALSWTADGTYFSLYSATSLVPPVAWSNETQTPAFTNALWIYPLPATNAPLRFYRLQTR